ncbi:MAG: hypothetical protein HWE25_10110 [Alphaproteobacteria bacterium]|nr:hypothetical protein [Alphaproteobacteria bacterium]
MSEKSGANDIASSNLTKVLVNKDEMLLLDEEVCRKLQEGGAIDGAQVYGSVRMLQWWKGVRSRLDWLGIIRYLQSPTMHHTWLTYEVVEIDGEFFRANTQNSFCRRCEWRGLAIAPEMDYYFISNEEAIERHRYAISKCSCTCPRCGQEILRQPAFFRVGVSGD